MALILDIIYLLFLLNDKASKNRENVKNDNKPSVVFASFLEDFKKYLTPHFPISEPISKSLEVYIYL